MWHCQPSLVIMIILFARAKAHEPWRARTRTVGSGFEQSLRLRVDYSKAPGPEK
jgi:hypothetical protein